MIKQNIRLVSPGVFLPSFEEISASQNDLIVRPLYLSICAADQRYFCGKRPLEVLKRKLPMTLFHEAVGEVLYSKINDFSPGDKVILLPLGPDFQEHSNYKINAFFRSSNADGFLQELLSLGREEVLKIHPTEDSFKVFVFAEMLSVCFHALSKLRNEQKMNNKTIGVWGDGIIAYLLSLILVEKNPRSKIIVFGKHYEKMSLFTHVTKTVHVQDIEKTQSVDIGFECVGGEKASEAINQCIKIINPEGEIVLLGVSEGTVSIDTRMVLEKGLSLRGSSRSNISNFIQAMDYLNKLQDLSKIEKVISNQVSIRNIEDVKRAFELDAISPFKTVLKLNL